MIRSSQKFYPTYLDYINLYYINDSGESINSPKRLALANYSPEDEFDAPERITDYEKIDDPTPVNPLDYYDNEDGFWDDFIKKKRKKLSETPIYAERKHFKH